MPFKRAKVVMLPTNQKAQIGNLVKSKCNELHILTENEVFIAKTTIVQHIYVLSGKKNTEVGGEIKVGDYAIGLDQIVYKLKEGEFPLRADRKIIASTDLSLGLEEAIKIANDSDCMSGSSGWVEIKNKNLFPQSSKSFIDIYIKEYNNGRQITDVLVEYEQDTQSWINAFNKSAKDFERLKINPKDRTITIRKIKNNYTFEEVEILINKHRDDNLSAGGTNKILTVNWIYENL